MVYIYTVAYWSESYIDRMIRNIRATTESDINITVAENQSPNPKVGKVCRQLLKEGLIDTYIKFTPNIYMQFGREAYLLSPPGEDSEDFIVVSDGDLLVPEGVDWVEEIRQRFVYPEIAWTSFNLNPINYLHGSHIKCESDRPMDMRYRMPLEYGGLWLAGVRKTVFEEYIQTTPFFRDVYFHFYIEDSDYEYGRIPIKLYHMYWDLDCQELLDSKCTIEKGRVVSYKPGVQENGDPPVKFKYRIYRN